MIVKSTRYVAKMRETSNANRIFVVKPLEKRPLARTIGRRKDNIKMYIRVLRGEDGRWMELV
jgi:hypothetical protein